MATAPAEPPDWIDGLSDTEAIAINYDWPTWARKAQVEPEGDWRVWLYLAGRGAGKSRAGAEWVRKEVFEKGRKRVNLIGATLEDAREIMIDGESGIMAICPPDQRPIYKRQDRALFWPNGAKSIIYTADQPDRLRGKQHEAFWGDEATSWRRPEAWDMALLGLRIGDDPRAFVSTTPKPQQLLRDIMADDETVVTVGSTYENRANLSPAFYKTILKRYKGTRLERQEIFGEILDDNPNALWSIETIHKSRITPEALGELSVVVVGVDPAVTSGEDSDETGIIVVGRDRSDPPNFYVLEDYTVHMAKPHEWARRVVHAHESNQANRVVAEVNQGGEMVKATIQTVDPGIAVSEIHVHRGKYLRAEPISALYAQGRVHHVGVLADLESQMIQWEPGLDWSPDRLDALVLGLTFLLKGGHSPDMARRALSGKGIFR